MDHNPLHKQLFSVMSHRLGPYFLQANQPVALPSPIFTLLGWNNRTSSSVYWWMSFCYSGQSRSLISVWVRDSALETFSGQLTLIKGWSYLTALWPPKIRVLMWIRNIVFSASDAYIGAHIFIKMYCEVLKWCPLKYFNICFWDAVVPWQRQSVTL